MKHGSVMRSLLHLSGSDAWLHLFVSSLCVCGKHGRDIETTTQHLADVIECIETESELIQ